MNRRRGIAWVIGLLLLANQAMAATRYHLKVKANPSVAMQIDFAITCPDPGANSLTILDASNDGTGQVAGVTGGPIVGALLAGSNPADTTVIAGATFYSELRYLLLASSHFDCDLEITEQGPPTGGVLSQVCLYYDFGTQIEQALGRTSDPTGVHALAAIDITGSPGGELSVFFPLSFVAPDTLLFDAQLVDVPREDDGARVRFGPIAPNPARGRIQFSFEFPRGGFARLRIYDVAGRVVAEPMSGNQTAGHRDLTWAGTGRNGSKVASGVYLAELRYGPQTVVRRFVLTR